MRTSWIVVFVVVVYRSEYERLTRSNRGYPIDDDARSEELRSTRLQVPHSPKHRFPPNHTSDFRSVNRVYDHTSRIAVCM